MRPRGGDERWDSSGLIAGVRVCFKFPEEVSPRRREMSGRRRGSIKADQRSLTKWRKWARGGGWRCAAINP